MSMTTKRRGRPTDPKLAALDARLVEIVEQHGRMMVRGVFYQAVKHALVEKTEAEAGKIGRRLLLLRRSGRIAYHRIVDESRIVYGLNRYDGLAGLADEAAELYRRDYWVHSDVNVQIWVEKRGLAGLLQPLVCHQWGLDLYVAGGQMSETYLYEAGTQIARGQKPTYVYAMTDFDPGGATIFNTLRDGSRAAPGGLSRFSDGVPVVVEQIALTGEQVKAWNLPTRPAKKTDKRAAKFMEQHGDISVELDAIEPEQLLALVGDAIARHMPAGDLERLKAVEAAERETVRDVLASLAGDYGDEDEDPDDDDEDLN